MLRHPPDTARGLAKIAWPALAGFTAATATASVVLAAWLDLHPCPLCIFQRLLFMLLAVFAGVAALSRWRGLTLTAGSLFFTTALGGMAVAASHSWLQWQPATNSIMCVSWQPGLIEKIIDRLGQLQPSLFLATGACEQKSLTLFGLSLANLAFLAFLACAGLALWALVTPAARAQRKQA